MSYVPLTPINQAIGSPEADDLHTVTALANDIIYDKSLLVGALLSFGIPANVNESLVDLINKVIPLSVNYIENLSDTWLDLTSSFSGDTDSAAAAIFTSVSPSPQPSETLADITTYFSGDADSGSVYAGGDALDTTKNIVFVVIDVINGTSLQVTSTSGMALSDTIMQGVNSTTILDVVDITHLTVGSTTGWVATSLVSTF
jgi:hypothetical protein